MTSPTLYFLKDHSKHSTIYSSFEIFAICLRPSQSFSPICSVNDTWEPGRDLEMSTSWHVASVREISLYLRGSNTVIQILWQASKKAMISGWPSPGQLLFLSPVFQRRHADVAVLFGKNAWALRGFIWQKCLVTKRPFPLWPHLQHSELQP